MYKGSFIYFLKRRLTFQNKRSHHTKIFKIYVEVKYNTSIAIRKLEIDLFHYKGVKEINE